LYAVCDASAPLSGTPLAGLDGALVWPVQADGIVAAVSLTGRCSVPAQAELAWQHEHVVERLMEQAAVLPARFGTLAPDAEAVAARLRSRRAEFAAGLDRVRGRVEISVRVLWDDVPDPPAARASPPPSGRAYLLQRQSEEQAAQARRERGAALAESLHAALGAAAVDAVRQVLATPRMLLTAAYLVDRGRVGEFQRGLDALSGQHGALRFMCTGPWPAYNFVAASDGAASDGAASDGAAVGAQAVGNVD
jgi:hypothetical protein